MFINIENHKNTNGIIIMHDIISVYIFILANVCMQIYILTIIKSYVENNKKLFKIIGNSIDRRQKGKIRNYIIKI